MKLFCIAHDDIWDGENGIAANLRVATGQQVTVNARDWDGEQWGDPYEVEVDEYIGGWQHIGHVGLWGAYVLHSTGARLTAIDNNAPANRWIALYVLSGSDGINDAIAEVARIAINAKLSARGFRTIPAGWSNRRMLRELYTLFETEYSKDEILERLL